jgi:hypothetical protein
MLSNRFTFVQEAETFSKDRVDYDDPKLPQTRCIVPMKIHTPRMRHLYLYHWTVVIRDVISHLVETQRPKLQHFWPLRGPVLYEGFLLPASHFFLIMRNLPSGTTHGPGQILAYAETDHPALPVSVENLDLWEHYMRQKFKLGDADMGIVLPAYDSGVDARKDLAMFSEAEGNIFNRQIEMALARQLSFVERTLPETIVNYSVSGPNSRIVINSEDHSTNTVTFQPAESGSGDAVNPEPPEFVRWIRWMIINFRRHPVYALVTFVIIVGIFIAACWALLERGITLEG